MEPDAPDASMKRDGHTALAAPRPVRRELGAGPQLGAGRGCARVKASRAFRAARGLTSCQVLDDLVQGVQDAALGLRRDLGLGKQLKDVAAGERDSGPRETRGRLCQVLPQGQALSPLGEATGRRQPSAPGGLGWGVGRGSSGPPRGRGSGRKGARPAARDGGRAGRGAWSTWEAPRGPARLSAQSGRQHPSTPEHSRMF